METSVNKNLGSLTKNFHFTSEFASMDRLTPSPAYLIRQNLPNIETSAPSPSLPEELVREIIDKIDKADNQTLTNLAQTCRDMARIAGTDVLLSYFYAARSTYLAGNAQKKVDVFCHLVDWTQGVANQLPDESVYKLIEYLSEMSEIAVTDQLQMTSLTKHTQVLFDICAKDKQSPLNAIQHAFTENSKATVTLLVSMQRLSIQLSRMYTAAAAALNTAQIDMAAMMADPHI